MLRRASESYAAHVGLGVVVGFVVFAFAGFRVGIVPPRLEPNQPAAYVATTRATIDEGLGNGTVYLHLRKSDSRSASLLEILSTDQYQRLIAQRAGLPPDQFSLNAVAGVAQVTGVRGSRSASAVVTALSKQPTYAVGVRAERAADARRLVETIVVEIERIVRTSGIFPAYSSGGLSVFSPERVAEGYSPASRPSMTAWLAAVVAAVGTFWLARRRVTGGRGRRAAPSALPTATPVGG